MKLIFIGHGRGPQHQRVFFRKLKRSFSIWVFNQLIRCWKTNIWHFEKMNFEDKTKMENAMKSASWKTQFFLESKFQSLEEVLHINFNQWISTKCISTLRNLSYYSCDSRRCFYYGFEKKKTSFTTWAKPPGVYIVNNFSGCGSEVSERFIQTKNDEFSMKASLNNAMVSYGPFNFDETSSQYSPPFGFFPF